MQIPKNILAIIPARKGSRGLKDKNLSLLDKHPLVVHTFAAARSSKLLTRMIMSTDDCRIAQLALRHGIEVPFLRPKYLASDRAKSTDVALHALMHVQKHEDYSPDLIVLLQPTAPLRTGAHIDDAIRKLCARRGDSLVSLCRLSEPHPYKLKRLKNGFVVPFLTGTDSTVPRQQLPEVYRLNGAIYIVTREVLLKEKSFFGTRVIPYFMEEDFSVNIDSGFDLLLAEAILKKRKQRHGKSVSV